MSIKDMLFDLQDEEYAIFQSKLIPNISKERIIGVRIPKLRILVKKIINEENVDNFLKDLPHYYYDENIIHALLISELKDYEKCIKEVNYFLPYVDNWAVCDILSPKIFKNHREDLIHNIKIWISSKHNYTCRFGIKMLMSHYLDDYFNLDYLEIPLTISNDDYYVKMMIAWFFATALAKHWEETIFYLEENRMNRDVHNKIIQKACESRRINDEQKNFLRRLKE